MSKCIDCKYLHGESANLDYPYPIILCLKGHWDGCENEDDLSEEYECDDFKNNSEK